MLGNVLASSSTAGFSPWHDDAKRLLTIQLCWSSHGSYRTRRHFSRTHKIFEQRVGAKRFGFQFRVELDAYDIGPTGLFDVGRLLRAFEGGRGGKEGLP